MNLRIVPVYAAILALSFIVLSVRVIQARGAARVALGTGGQAALERRIRAHGNFAEYCPLTLLLLAMAELRGAPSIVLHALCIGLLAGRLLHAWGVSQTNDNFRFRTAAMTLTFTVLAAAAVTLLLG